MPTKLHTPTLAPLNAGARRDWAGIPVTIASDITAGRLLVDPRIRPLRAFPLGVRMVGRAVTGWCERSDFGPALHAIDAATEGDVVVLDAGGCVQTAYVGELLCGAARRRKLAGLIVNGAVRDIDTLASWDDFPVYCLGTTGKGPLSKERGAVNGPIVFGGVPVEPGDIVLGDNDGLIIVPSTQAAALLPQMQERVRMEGEWAAALASGRALVDVFNVPEAI
ncbi:MAG: dimethylmenaquinone methyltransferase [Rhizobiaceae bacterium]|nr:dimethylmenaquinone methyltransferase [Rhizobiaceae bacterium]